MVINQMIERQSDITPGLVQQAVFTFAIAVHELRLLFRPRIMS